MLLDLRYYFSILLFFILIFFKTIDNVQALPDDNLQPMHISANELLVDNQKGIAIYTGNVQVRQGSIKLDADRVKVTKNTENNLDKIEAFGKNQNRAFIEEQPSKTEPIIKGWANQINYFANPQRMELIQSAELHRQQDIYRGAFIEYLFSARQVNANSNGHDQKADNRVNITIMPDQKQSAKS